MEGHQDQGALLTSWHSWKAPQEERCALRNCLARPPPSTTGVACERDPMEVTDPTDLEPRVPDLGMVSWPAAAWPLGWRWRWWYGGPPGGRDMTFAVLCVQG